MKKNGYFSHFIACVEGFIFGGIFAFSTLLISAQAPTKPALINPKAEEPTMAVRCYASNVTAAQLPIELQYLQDFGWEDISVRAQSPTLLKVTARAFYSLESRDTSRFDQILNFSPAASVVTCG